jgi:organic radical activating enzyme
VYSADIVQRARDGLKRLRQLAVRLKYDRPGSPYRCFRDADRAVFANVLNVWRPANDSPAIILRWLMTEWCNYACPYCTQTHARDAPKGPGRTAHAFDNFPREDWQDALSRHFADARLALLITGGEPFVDRKAMPAFLAFLVAMPMIESIRIDTNAWWRPSDYRGLEKSRITLMCTFHPSQTTADRFLARIDAIQDAGFHIAMVNYVMNADNLPHYLNYKEQLRSRGIPLHPNPLWDSVGVYSAADLALLQNELHEVDFRFRGGAATLGLKCLFPALAYELDYRGQVHVGCHPAASGSFFAEHLPRPFAGPVPCPHGTCACLDKYSFLEGVDRNLSLDPLRTYGDLLRSDRRLSNT